MFECGLTELMLMDLEEYETPNIGAALGTGHVLPAQPTCWPILSKLDYLFHGRSPSAPKLVLSGGVTRNGIAVSGAGSTVEQALVRMCGEAAEQLALARPALPEASGTLPKALTEHPGLNCAPTSWVEGCRLSDSSPIALPRELCRVGLPDRRHQSEGLGAAPTVSDAMAHGALELIERDTVHRWWGGVLRARQIAADDLVVDLLGPDRPRRTVVLSLENELGLPVLFAGSCDPDGFNFSFGCAARPDPVDAVRAALRELVLSEFGLSLTQSRVTQKGFATLSASERHDLSLAERVNLDGLLADRTCGEAPLPSYSGDHALTETYARLDLHYCLLGEIAPGFQVVKTLSERLLPGHTDDSARGPGASATHLTSFAEIALFA